MDILNDGLLSMVDDLFQLPECADNADENTLFMHGNAPCHKMKTFTNFFEKTTFLR